MPHIKQIANLWSLRGYPSFAQPLNLDRQFAAVARAGFDGLTHFLTPEHRRLADKHRLEHLVGFISSSDPDEFARRIREQKEGGGVEINVQMDDHDTPPAAAARHWVKMVRAAEKVGGVTVSLEVHRNTCTETPEKTYEIAERFEKITGNQIRLTFDFSHFAVVKHLEPNLYAARLLDHPDLVRQSSQCHLRPFNGHHCQIAVHYRGKLTPEGAPYLAFVEQLMKLWARAPANRERTWFICPELGPYDPTGFGYNVTGLPPGWPVAQRLRQEYGRIWNQVNRQSRTVDTP